MFKHEIQKIPPEDFPKLFQMGVDKWLEHTLPYLKDVSRQDPHSYFEVIDEHPNQVDFRYRIGLPDIMAPTLKIITDNEGKLTSYEMDWRGVTRSPYKSDYIHMSLTENTRILSSLGYEATIQQAFGFRIFRDGRMQEQLLLNNSNLWLSVGYVPHIEGDRVVFSMDRLMFAEHEIDPRDIAKILPHGRDISLEVVLESLLPGSQMPSLHWDDLASIRKSDPIIDLSNVETVSDGKLYAELRSEQSCAWAMPYHLKDQHFHSKEKNMWMIFIRDNADSRDMSPMRVFHVAFDPSQTSSNPGRSYVIDGDSKKRYELKTTSSSNQGGDIEVANLKCVVDNIKDNLLKES